MVFCCSRLYARFLSPSPFRFWQWAQHQTAMFPPHLPSPPPQVKSVADELYQAEMETTIASWEAESKLKIAKLQAKQQTEYEALMQRGTKVGQASGGRGRGRAAA